jgi:hypothetical protein
MAGSWGAMLIGNPINAAGQTTGGAVSNGLIDCPGGIMVFAAAGTFNGATINLQFLGPDGSTLITAGTQTTLTAAGAGVAYLPPCQVQATVTGGPPSGIIASLARVVR